MSIQEQIEQKLHEAFQPEYLEIMNESHMHRGSATESHFKVILVSELFSGKRLILRHREVNTVLAYELKHQIHALSLHLYTPEQWGKQDNIPLSPPCSNK